MTNYSQSYLDIKSKTHGTLRHASMMHLVNAMPLLMRKQFNEFINILAAGQSIEQDRLLGVIANTHNFKYKWNEVRELLDTMKFDLEGSLLYITDEHGTYGENALPFFLTALFTPMRRLTTRTEIEEYVEEGRTILNYMIRQAAKCIGRGLKYYMSAWVHYTLPFDSALNGTWSDENYSDSLDVDLKWNKARKTIGDKEYSLAMVSSNNYADMETARQRISLLCLELTDIVAAPDRRIERQIYEPSTPQAVTDIIQYCEANDIPFEMGEVGIQFILDVDDQGYHELVSYVEAGGQ